MKPGARKTIAIGWLAVAIPFGGVAAFQLYCMLAGIYDPVQQDQMPPENIAGLKTWLISTVVATFLSSEGHRNPMTVPELEQRMRGWISGEYRAIL